MAHKLTEDVVLRIMREEWTRRFDTLVENLPTKANVDGEVKNVISPGLKVKSKTDGLLYTITAVSKDRVTMTDPNGAANTVADAELEKNYELD